MHETEQFDAHLSVSLRYAACSLDPSAANETSSSYTFLELYRTNSRGLFPKHGARLTSDSYTALDAPEEQKTTCFISVFVHIK